MVNPAALVPDVQPPGWLAGPQKKVFEPYRHQGDEEVGLVTSGLAALVIIAICNGHCIAKDRGPAQLTLKSLWLPLALRPITQLSLSTQ